MARRLFVEVRRDDDALRRDKLDDFAAVWQIADADLRLVQDDFHRKRSLAKQPRRIEWLNDTITDL